MKEFSFEGAEKPKTIVNGKIKRVFFKGKQDILSDLLAWGDVDKWLKSSEPRINLEQKNFLDLKGKIDLGV